MQDTFLDKFGREWTIKLTKYDPAPYSHKRFYSVSAETTKGAGSEFKFFAAFDDVNEAISKAKTFADLLPYA